MGKSFSKNKIQIGDISIKAVVGKDLKVANYNFTNMQNTSLGFVMNLSEIVASGIFEVVKYG